MKKLKLSLDEIKVESFEINSKREEKKGTVHGQVLITDDYVTECCTVVTWCTCYPLTENPMWTACR